MQFSISTVIVALATLHTVDAGWKFTAYSTEGCIMSGEGAFSREIASSETVPECFTFGQDMPGTSCIEHYPASATTLPCLYNELTPKSIDVEGNCAFYNTPNCEGDSPTLTSPHSIDCLTGMDIMSYKCWAE
ncbi:hypothetical protein DER45DRAFT_570547 [Fusarium avenaceum]|nr:hypothetical protein DER45DRAFT_570547 [Fusarium avenaceum]